MAILTRKQKELLVLELYYNQNKNYREISKQVRVYPREIKKILDKASAENESEHSLSKQAKAYQMFDEGKTPMQGLPEPEVTKFYKESLTLKQVSELNRIYLETGGNLALFLNLYKMAKNYRIEQIAWLIRVANNGLPELELGYNNLKSEVDWFVAKKQYLLKLIQNHERQISALGKTIDKFCQSCEQEGKKLSDLQTKRMNEESTVRRLEKNKAEIRK